MCTHAGKDSAPSDSHVADGPSIDGLHMPAPRAHSDDGVSVANKAEESETHMGSDDGITKPVMQDNDTGKGLCHEDLPWKGFHMILDSAGIPKMKSCLFCLYKWHFLRSLMYL